MIPLNRAQTALVACVFAGLLTMTARPTHGQSAKKKQSAFVPYTEPIAQTNVKIDLVPIPGGRFEMGSSDSEVDREDDEGPVRSVEIEPFWMSKTEITWDAYDVWGEKQDINRRKILRIKPTKLDEKADAVTRPTPPYTDMSFKMGKGKHPAICMTQHAARKYCDWLTEKTGHYYRLPTEAEWEYACRAGSKTRYHFGDDDAQLADYAWYTENSDDKYQQVGKKKPNKWGLHDMHGNVSEWVLDQYLSYDAKQTKNPLAVPKTLYPRVVRGGGWDDSADWLRSAKRIASEEGWKDQDPQLPKSIWYHTDALSVGFRIVRPVRVPTEKERVEKWDKTAPEQKDPPQESDIE
jgi:formylglycine-generating enzyme required for sulfatase activity